MLPQGKITKVLFTEQQIALGVSELAEKINADYKDKILTVVCLSNGAIIFSADLIRKLNIPMQFDTLSVSSYSGTKSLGEVRISNGLKLSVKDRHVLIIDEILDTGHTLQAVLQELQNSGAASLKTCVLLNKQERRVIDIKADYCAFEIPDEFVIGYGLDYQEHYRQLPYIGVLELNK